MTNKDYPIAIIGAGPVGLAAAAHLLERSLEPMVFEAGAAVGSSVRQWGHVRLFSPWRECLDAASVRLLEGEGWTAPEAEVVPLGRDLVAHYLEPLAAVPALASRIQLSSRVVAVGRDLIDKVRTDGREEAPFALHVDQANGERVRYRASAVIDTSGTWTSPNPMGAGGLLAPGERAQDAHIRYGIPDVLGAEKARYAGRRVLVVGGGHSAANVLLDLARLRLEAPETEIVWAIRRPSPDRTYGGEDADALSERGALGKRLHQLVDRGGVEMLTSFSVDEVERQKNRLLVYGMCQGERVVVAVDEVVVCTGFRPDFSFLREVRLSLDAGLESARALAPLIDPNIHSCGTVRPHGERELRHEEAGFYIAGMKSYGRAPTFLLLTGYEQVRSIVAALAGDREAADRVELCLPETGVCSAPQALVDDLLAPLQIVSEAQEGVSSTCCTPSARPAVERDAAGDTPLHHPDPVSEVTG